jgi:outer membrane protein OmpA-like peptidoglycan-associated protein
MKKRLRRFQAEASERENQEQIAAEEEDYMWSDAETGGQAPSAKPANETVPQSVRPEELRMEISRNLQEGRDLNAPVPAAPLRPDLDDSVPSAYDVTVKGSTTAPLDLPGSIQSSLRQPAAPASDWQVKVANTAPTIAHPTTATPLQAGQIITLDQVRFASGSSQLYPEAASSLVQWAELLRQQPALRIEIRAYTHGNQDAAIALQLTRERAENIATYWHQLGVSSEQVSYRGYGQLSPLVPAHLSDAQQKNERIELIILELPAR